MPLCLYAHNTSKTNGKLLQKMSSFRWQNFETHEQVCNEHVFQELCEAPLYYVSVKEYCSHPQNMLLEFHCHRLMYGTYLLKSRLTYVYCHDLHTRSPLSKGTSPFLSVHFNTTPVKELCSKETSPVQMEDSRHMNRAPCVLWHLYAGDWNLSVSHSRL